jgi:hypothetical protein
MLTPILCILTARGLDQYFFKSKGRRKTIARALVILVIFLVHFYFLSSAFMGSTQSEFGVRAKMEVAEYIRDITEEGDKIWTTEADIAFFAQRLTVTPDTIWKFPGFYEDNWGYLYMPYSGIYAYVGPYAGYPGGVVTLDDIHQALESQKPKVVVIMKYKFADKLIWNGIDSPVYRREGLADYILAHYNLSCSLYDIEIYVRK